MSTHERQSKYKIAGPATWELIRAAYLAGESAPALAERFGVGVYAIRKRITIEKWSKRDYAAALEARGINPPPKHAPLNVAERFAAHYVPPPAPFAEEARAPTPPEPESLERAALASLSAALAKGKASDARAFVGVAEAMRKRAADERGAAQSESEPQELSDEGRAMMVMWMFEKVAYVAAIMVHEPHMAPNGFFDLIKRWREINLGEDQEAAAAKAAAMTKSQEHWLSGAFAAMLPEDLREHVAAKWDAMRKGGPTPAGRDMVDFVAAEDATAALE